MHVLGLFAVLVCWLCLRGMGSCAGSLDLAIDASDFGP